MEKIFTRNDELEKHLILFKKYFNFDQVIKSIMKNNFIKIKNSFEKILKKNPKDDNILHQYALTLQKNGFIKEAISYLTRALNIKPNNIEYLNNLSFFYFISKDFQSALTVYLKVSYLNPNNEETLNNIGITLNKLSRFKDAINYFNKAIEINSKKFSFFYNKANSYLNLQEYENAIQNYTKSLSIKPNHLNSLHNRAFAHEELLQLDNALIDYENCIKINPAAWGSYLSKSHIHLIKGEFEIGWKLREYRWKIDKFNQIHKILDATKFWLGKQNIQGKKILIPFEQGLGDTIQFCRLVKNLKSFNCEIILLVQKSLLNLIKTLDKDITVITTDNQNIKYDFYCPLLSLPFVLKINQNNIPKQVPYLEAQKDKISQWKSEINKSKKLKIGVAWKGNPLNGDDYKRSYNLREVIDLFESKYDWISLHHEISIEEEEILINSKVRNLANLQKDFDDLAAICECLDLIITVDTSIVHLAGALGKKTYLILAYNPDFRWLKDINSSPWYPNLKLFRKNKNSNWRELIKRAIKEI